MPKKKLTKKDVERVSSYLRKKPRTTKDLLHFVDGEYLESLRQVGQGETILTKKCWTEHGWQFKYWIKPQRMGKNWKKVYRDLGIEPDYDVEFGDF